MAKSKSKKTKSLESPKILDKKELEQLTPELQSNYIARLIAEVADARDRDPCEICWLDFRDHIKYSFGQNTHGLIPRLITRLGGFAVIRDAHFPKKITNEYIERVELMETTRVNRKFANLEAYDELFLGKLKETLSSVDHKIKIRPFKPSVNKKTSRVLNLVLSDLHFQSLIKQSETGHAYGSKEEARRASYIAQQVANYKLDHRDETELAIWILGDIIQNTLHDARDGSPVAEQSAAAFKYLAEAVGYLASAFKKVTVYCATGNHGRNTGRHKTRAIHQKWDSLETSIYYGLKSFFSIAAPNVAFVIPKTPWVEASILGHAVYATHGDTSFNPGNPGKAVNTERLQTQSNNINAARKESSKQPYQMFFAGHVHRAMSTFLDNGSAVFTNAPLCPPDGFAVSIGINSTQCGQWLIETTKDHVVGDYRFLRVGKSQDKDKNLDEIVSPYKGGFDHSPKLSKFKKKK